LGPRAFCKLVPGGIIDTGMGQAKLVKCLIEQTLAKGNGFFRLDRTQVMADFRAGTTRADVIQPFGAGSGGRRRDDFNGVSALELGAEGDKVAIDARSNGLIAYIGMNGVGKVNGGGPARQ